MRHDHDKAYVYSTAFEYLSAKRFFEYQRRHDPQFSLLFINMLAQAQHYYRDPSLGSCTILTRAALRTGPLPAAGYRRSPPQGRSIV